MLIFATTQESLQTIITNLEAVHLKGIALLESGESLATLEREAVRDATLELIAYTNACNKALHRLSQVPAIPLNQPLLDWVL